MDTAHSTIKNYEKIFAKVDEDGFVSLDERVV
jgi:sugar-phosphatase